MKTSQITNPFEQYMGVNVVGEDVDVAQAVNSVFFTTDEGLIHLVLSGLSLALATRPYTATQLVSLQDALESRLEMFRDPRIDSESLTAVATRLLADVTNRIDAMSLIKLVRKLAAENSQQAIVDAIPALQAAIAANVPQISIEEAHEVNKILHRFSLRYEGRLSDQLDELSTQMEHLFQDESV